LGSIIKFDAGLASSLLGTFGKGFEWGKNIFGVDCINKIYPTLSPTIRGRIGWMQAGAFG